MSKEEMCARSGMGDELRSTLLELEDSEEGVSKLAWLAGSIVIQMNAYDQAVNDGRMSEPETKIRHETLLDLAYQLELARVVKILYEQPIPPDQGRVIDIPEEMKYQEQAVALDLAIISMLDQKTVSSNLHAPGNPMSAKPGDTPDAILRRWD